MSRTKFAAIALLTLAVFPIPLAQAEVTAQSATGFVIKLTAEVTASKAETWNTLIAPNKWWSGQHTYTGDAANLYLDAQATGCFCEKLPKPTDALLGQRMGSVEHMHVVYADPERGVLRMVGGLGPLQGEAVHGTLTITLKSTEAGTQIEWEYVVGGYMRMDPEKIAPMVDKVLGEQLGRLAALLNSPVPEPAPAKPS